MGGGGGLCPSVLQSGGAKAPLAPLVPPPLLSCPTGHTLHNRVTESGSASPLFTILGKGNGPIWCLTLLLYLRGGVTDISMSHHNCLTSVFQAQIMAL